MDNRTILILQGPKGTPQELSPLANAVAAVGVRLHVLQVDEMPAIPTYAIEGYPVPAGWDQTRRELADNLKTRGAETATYLANLGVATETDIIYETAVEMAHQIVPHALRADVAVITNDLRENKDVFQSLSHGILFESPIPLILNPTENAITPKRVTVAWSESLPTARAVHAALPILKAAQDVTLCVIDPKEGRADNSQAIAAWLSHHGCKVTVVQTPSKGQPIAEVLLRCALEDGADLLVIGAFGHSRMRQRLFGGTTRSIIEQTKQAVFLAH